MAEQPFQIREDERVDARGKDGNDRMAHHLYSIVTTTKDGALRREALLFLGALRRGGSKEAAQALEKIRKK